MDLNNYKDLLNEASELYNKIPKKEKNFYGDYWRFSL